MLAIEAFGGLLTAPLEVSTPAALVGGIETGRLVSSKAAAGERSTAAI
jgi:hypothetical protein